MPTQPLSYDSLKTVLQHMDANVRFRISLQIPSTRTAERVIPLKIDSLTFDGRKIVVNKTEYKFGVYRKYHDDHAYVHNDIQWYNDHGGCPHNLDQYGSTLWPSDDETMTPGDVDIGSAFRERLIIFRDAIEIEIQRLELNIPRFEEIVAEARPQGEKLLETMYATYQTAFEYSEAIFPRGTPVTEIESRIKNDRARLVLYHCSRGNTPPPFEMFFQLTTSSTSGKQIQWMKYNKTLHEAQKHLNTCLFGKRLFPIQVKWLDIDDSIYGKILRLPLGLKLKIQNLKICSKVAETYEALKHILEPSSVPFSCLHIEAMQLVDEDLRHAIATSAKKLVIWSSEIRDWRTILPNIPNRRVHLKVSEMQMKTHFSFGIIDNEEEMTKLLESIEQRFDGVNSGERSLTLRMNDSLNLKVFYKKDPHPTLRIDKPQWILKMKVIQNEAE